VLLPLLSLRRPGEVVLRLPLRHPPHAAGNRQRDLSRGRTGRRRRLAAASRGSTSAPGISGNALTSDNKPPIVLSNV
jgi:hypothetical protein